MKYKAPINIAPRSMMGFIDADLRSLRDDDIARDLTAYYELKAKQVQCKHLDQFGQEIRPVHNFCYKCGADLTKGDKT